MSEWVTLFKGGAGSAESLSKFLESRSVESRRKAERGPLATRPGRRASRTRVEVRPDDLENARALFAEWERPRAARAAGRTRRLVSMVAIASVLPIVWVASFYFEIPGTPYPEPMAVFASWFVGVIVVAQIAASRSRSETVDRSL